MSYPSVFCIIGYAIAQAIVVQATGAGGLGQLCGIVFVVPISFYCQMLDRVGR